MNEIMKTNPPSKLAKKLISLSEADNWEEAKNEWKMERYYHISEHCSCLCCSKGVHDMTVIENIFNTNQMHICNSCASLYFGIQESLKIESVVRRLKKNKNSHMDNTCLTYLHGNGILGLLEFKNYELVRSSRKDAFSVFYRQRINERIIHFTNFANKSIFEKIEILIAWSKKMENPHCISVFVEKWKKLADTGQVDIAWLDDFIEKNEIALSPFTKQDKELALEAIQGQVFATLDLEEYFWSTKCKLTKDSAKRILFPFCMEGLEDGEVSQEEAEKEAMENMRERERELWAFYLAQQQDSQSDSWNEDNARMNKIIKEGIAVQESGGEKKVNGKENSVAIEM